MIRTWTTLLLLGLAVQVSACTTWISMPDSNELKQIILHKNRDAGKGKDLPIALHLVSDPDCKYRWMDLCSTFFVNEKGFAILNNAMPKVSDHKAGEKRMLPNSSALMRKIAGNCATVQEAIALIQKYLEPGDTWIATSNYLLTDGKVTGMLELSAKHFAFHECKTGFMVHTNDYIFPEMMQYSCGKDHAMIKSATRLVVTRNQLGGIIREKGFLSIADILKVSRFQNGVLFPDQAPFRNSTVCAATYLYDQEFPEVLGTILVQFGPTNYAIAIPVAVGCRKVPASFDIALGKLGFRLKHAASGNHKLRKKMNALEQNLWSEYLPVREDARKLLRDGKEKEARELLETTLQKQEEEVRNFMLELLKKNEKF